MSMYDAQLEMSFSQRNGPSNARQRRLSRAQWWFRRMRQIVDRAAEWQAPQPRPEQMLLAGSERP